MQARKSKIEIRKTNIFRRGKWCGFVQQHRLINGDAMPIGYLFHDLAGIDKRAIREQTGAKHFVLAGTVRVLNG